jgi:predicted flap endonuclease-1-like 5' DNA nuclease
MFRTIFGTLVAVVLAGTGVALLMWLLWWLWSRHEEESATPVIEIEAEPPDAEVETEEPAMEVEPPAIEVEERAAVMAAEVPAVEVEAEGPAEEIAPSAVRVESEAPPKPDDLKRIEGIGPKIAGVLQAAGITTFARLADSDVNQLRQVLEDADPRLLRLADPTSWPDQASLAAAGNWDALEALKQELKAGRRR